MFDSGDAFEREIHGPSPLLTPDCVMLAWRAMIESEVPWCSMPPDDRAGEMRAVLAELMDVSGGIECAARRRRVRDAARGHGAYRGAQRCPEIVVFSDFVVLRSATRYALRARGASRSSARDFVRALLPDWQFARRMALTAHGEVRGVGNSGA